MRSWCDNEAVIHVANNHVFHKGMKLIEVDCHITRYHVEKNIETRFVESIHKLTYLFTKPLGKSRVHFICLEQAGMYDIHDPAEKEC